MPAPSPDTFDTQMLQGCIDRWQAGDRGAADELLRGAEDRLNRLARKMCRGFPRVAGLAETEDVLNPALVRLLNTLRTLRPATTRDFFNLAGVHLRRELIDLARHFKNKVWVSLNPGPDDSAGPPGAGHPAAPVAEDLDHWVRFHEAVERLPAEEREVVGLVFYHGWTREQIAALFGRSVKTVTRRWQDACRNLRRMVDGQLPGG